MFEVGADNCGVRGGLGHTIIPGRGDVQGEGGRTGSHASP